MFDFSSTSHYKILILYLFDLYFQNTSDILCSVHTRLKDSIRYLYNIMFLNLLL